MQTVRFSLFGKLKISDHNCAVIELEGRRAQELLCYLLVYRNRLHEREKLATLMWCDAPAAQSKKYLRQALWKMQTAFNPISLSDHDHILLVEQEQIGINPGLYLWLDIAIFDQAFGAVQDMRGQDLNLSQINGLKEAVQLYKGDLLEGWYQDWCIHERERYQNMYLAMLDKLLNHSEASQQYETGIAYGLQILAYDHARESTHQRLMHLYYAAGDRTTALHQYELCVAALQKELGVGPSEHTLALYQQICADHIAPLLSIPARPRQQPIQTTSADPIDEFQQLQQIQLTLITLQQQVAYLMDKMQRNHRQQLMAADD